MGDLTSRDGSRSVVCGYDADKQKIILAIARPESVVKMDSELVAEVFAQIQVDPVAFIQWANGLVDWAWGLPYFDQARKDVDD